MYLLYIYENIYMIDIQVAFGKYGQKVSLGNLK